MPPADKTILLAPFPIREKMPAPEFRNLMCAKSPHPVCYPWTPHSSCHGHPVFSGMHCVHTGQQIVLGTTRTDAIREPCGRSNQLMMYFISSPSLQIADCKRADRSEDGGFFHLGDASGVGLQALRWEPLPNVGPPSRCGLQRMSGGGDLPLVEKGRNESMAKITCRRSRLYSNLDHWRRTSYWSDFQDYY